MKVLITGGCGFIGSHLTELHLSCNDDIWIIDDLSTGRIENIISFPQYKKIIFEQKDISNWDTINEAVKWADRIYHMAAVVGIFHVLANPIKLFKTNIAGTDNLLQAIIKNKATPRLIIASSSSVYGHSDKTSLSEDDDLILLANSHPLRGYAISKITDEVLATSYAGIYDLNYIILRLFNTVGPRQSGQYGMVVPRFVEQACTNKPITVFGTGEQTRSFCDVRDSVVMIKALADNPKTTGQIINVGQDVAVNINYLANLVKEKANSSSIIEHVDYSLAYGRLLSDIKQRKPNINKLKSFINYKHQWTLDKTIESLVHLFSNKKSD